MPDEEKSDFSAWSVPDPRPDLAFPKLTEEMIERLRPFGVEETYSENTALINCGEREADMFVVLAGQIDMSLPAMSGESRIIAHHQKFDFSGELNLLNSQGSLVNARTVGECRLLRIPRNELQRMMRAEGDIANLIMQATIWRRIGIIGEPGAGVVLKGRAGDAETIQLQRFLLRNTYPHKIVEETQTGSPQAEDPEVDTPSLVLSDGRMLHRPSIAQLADELGITELPDPHRIYDVAVVGAGPSGLAAAVYAASEGLCTIVIESIAPGGQAGTSSKIENYLGFPTGISGQRLASRAQLQALKFGVQFAISRPVVTAEQIDGIHRLSLADGIPVCSRSVVVASGAQYRALSLTNNSRFENRGIYYAATAMESLLCRDNEVIVVGGGNSAGQAAMFLSGIAKHVYHIIRGESLATSMSQYLVSRVENSSRITLCPNCEIEKLEGESSLERVTWTNRVTRERVVKPIRSVFVMIGAEPNSGWLFGTVRLDKKGFILTGGADGFESTPYATSVPGIFAVGDVRSKSVKRVASAVGEGSVVISDVHRYLADHRNTFAVEPNSALAALRSASAAVRPQIASEVV